MLFILIIVRPLSDTTLGAVGNQSPTLEQVIMALQEELQGLMGVERWWCRLKHQASTEDSLHILGENSLLFIIFRNWPLFLQAFLLGCN